MSLHGTFNVGPRAIGNFEIIRRSNVDTNVLGDDTVSDYEYRVTHYVLNGEPETKTGTISHRYGDGAVELLAKAFIMSSPVE